jgi:hypothetical protein
VDDMASTRTLYVEDDAASTSTPGGGWQGEHRYIMWWIKWRAPVHYVVDGVASTSTPCGGWQGEHRYTMWSCAPPRLVSYVVDHDGAVVEADGEQAAVLRVEVQAHHAAVRRERVLRVARCSGAS